MAETRKHTPGPWKVVDHLNVVTDDDTEALIARVDDGDVSEHQAEGDAKLIAAAPDLLRACEAALNDWREHLGNMARHEPDYLELCRAALKKARGQSS